MLRLRGLVKRYPSFALGPLSLDVGAEVLAVLGPSGSGKSTLLSLISGTDTPDEGTVQLNETSLGPESLEARGTARVFQESALFPHLTARENIEYAAAASQRVDELAALLEIEDILEQTAGTLSGGENRRVEVARALASDPAALLLDEPTAGLDTPVRRRLRGHFRRLLTDLHIPVLYVTHNQAEASTVADRVAVLQEGELQQVGPPAEVFNRPATTFVARFTGNPNVFPARLVSHPSGARIEWSGKRLAAPASDIPPETDVWLCIRPEQVELCPEAGAQASGNVVEATVTQCIFQGSEYVVLLRVGDDGEESSLRARVLPSRARVLDVGQGDRIQVRLRSGPLHLIRR
ncbi:hypothetical protein BSZ35_18820 [Salinibacter sp. 10B]|uniref:ABC transporter ATP-binding protein n=1 Tax=Salinibacter sp. 10B TaxID=1923971 RepID=UPI000CF47CFE|nr:ABC transporter ATP-binding protein [Salinibacter sp. 10B]PQJ26972.1 hypothetical protein BSZ35_18820 [Salinibacter sp. 10B]